MRKAAGHKKGLEEMSRTCAPGGRPAGTCMRTRTMLGVVVDAGKLLSSFRVDRPPVRSCPPTTKVVVPTPSRTLQL